MIRKVVLILCVALAALPAFPKDKPALDVSPIQAQLAEKDLEIAQLQAQVAELQLQLQLATNPDVIAMRARNAAAVKAASDASDKARQSAQSKIAPPAK